MQTLSRHHCNDFSACVTLLLQKLTKLGGICCLTCFHRIWRGYWASPGCAVACTSAGWSAHPSRAAWKGLPASSHLGALRNNPI